MKTLILKSKIKEKHKNKKKKKENSKNRDIMQNQEEQEKREKLLTRMMFNYLAQKPFFQDLKPNKAKEREREEQESAFPQTSNNHLSHK